MTGAAEDGSSQSANSGGGGGGSAGVDGVLGGITVVGCEAEGVSAVPQTAGRSHFQTCLEENQVLRHDYS